MENYLVNPVNRGNPVVTLRHPAFRQKAWRSGSTGQFGPLAGKVKTIHPKKRKAAKKAKRHGTKAMIVSDKEMNFMNPLMLLNKRRRKAGRHVRRAKAKSYVINPKRRTARKSRKASRTSRVMHGRVRKLALRINPHRRIRHSRRFRRNPLFSGSYNKEVKLVLTGVGIVAGAMAGSYAINKITPMLPASMQTPVVRIAAYVVLGSVAYMLLEKSKKVSSGVSIALGAAIMAPGLLEAKDMLLAKMSGGVSAPTAPQAVAYGDETLNAWVPGTSHNMAAYVPQSGLSDGAYGSAY